MMKPLCLAALTGSMGARGGGTFFFIIIVPLPEQIHLGFYVAGLDYGDEI